MRDIFKSDGLSKLIKAIIEEYDPTISDILAEKDMEVKQSLFRFHFNNQLQKTIAHYSVGDTKELVTSSLMVAIDAFPDGFEFDDGYGDYDNMIWMICLSILCEINEREFSKITSVLKRDGANDMLLSFLIQSKDPDWPSSRNPVIQEHPYASAVNLNSANDIKYYLDRVWYQGHSDAFWHDMHKNKRVNNYFGYWAWEAAAIAKIKGIDDSSLKKQKYYPYDAVHW